MSHEARGPKDGAQRTTNPMQLLALLLLAVGIIWVLVTLGRSNPYPEKIKSAEQLVNLDYLNNSSNSMANPDGGYVGDGEAQRSVDDLKSEEKSWEESRTTQIYLSSGVALLGGVLLLVVMGTSGAARAPRPAGTTTDTTPDTTSDTTSDTSSESDLRSRLAQLTALRDAGDISQTEHDQQRARLLDGI